MQRGEALLVCGRANAGERDEAPVRKQLHGGGADPGRGAADDDCAHKRLGGARFARVAIQTVLNARVSEDEIDQPWKHLHKEHGNVIALRHDDPAARTIDGPDDRVCDDVGARQAVAHCRIHGRAHEARFDQRHADAVHANLAANGIVEPAQSELRTGIDAHDGRFAGDRPNVNNRALLLCNHHRQHRVHGTRAAQEIDRNDALDIFVGFIAQRRRRADAGDIRKHVDGPELSNRRRHQSVDISAFSDVGRNGQRSDTFAAGLRRKRLERFALAFDRGQYDVRTPRGERTDGRRTDRARSARYDRYHLLIFHLPEPIGGLQGIALARTGLSHNAE